MLAHNKASIAFIAAILGIFGIMGCSSNVPENELAVINQIMVMNIDPEQVKKLEMNHESASKFPAVSKMYKIEGLEEACYAVLVNPRGYRAPIDIMVVIDGKKQEVKGIKVIQQDETPGYGEWLFESWFVDRFKGKKVDKYLQRVILEAAESNQIIQITSATVTTQAVLNGVNAAMGIYRETVLGEASDPVSLNVEGYIRE